MEKTRRIHSLDSLRAIMMLLGLIIHSAITYGAIDYENAWPLKDPNSTSLFNDYLVLLIHAFRMETFFMVAGFFGALLFYERKFLVMVKNRTNRIFLPFVVFVILSWPINMFAIRYTSGTLAGSENAFKDALAYFNNIMAFIPKITFHLWFLYYLSMITLAAVVLALLFRKLPRLSANIQMIFDKVIQKPLVRVVAFMVLTTLTYYLMNTSMIQTSMSFVPDLPTFAYYFGFYLVGWMLYKSKRHLDTFTNYDRLSTLIALILFSVYFFKNNSLGYEATIILKSLISWLFVFGITGLFIRYTSKHSPIMRYISDASYWVYLIHLTGTLLVPSVLANWSIPAIAKFFIVFMVTGVLCFLSYHYLVRGSFIGRFLNGRTYSKKLSDIKKTEEVALSGPYGHSK